MLRFGACGLIILLASAPAALAVDGTVLINQSTSTNGLPNCPTGGHFPIIICQPGSYRLSGNLTVPDANTSAIQITSDNVTLDLNGYSIAGPVVCSGSPVTSCSPNNGTGFGISSTNSYITISNGYVRGFGISGIFIPANGGSGIGARIEGVTASNNNLAGIALGTDAIVTLCHGDANGVNGILGGGTVSNSSALFNGSDGISWFGSATGNTSIANGGSGFYGGGVFTSNTARGNSSFAIHAFTPSVIISNQFFLNSGGTINAVSGSVVLNNIAQ